jgi:hypothetical protein
LRRCSSLPIVGQPIGGCVRAPAGGNAAHTPSPVCLNIHPPCRSIASRNTSSCAASADRIAAGSASQRRVEPSMSVNRNVTVPDGPPTHRTLRQGPIRLGGRAPRDRRRSDVVVVAVVQVGDVGMGVHEGVVLMAVRVMAADGVGVGGVLVLVVFVVAVLVHVVQPVVGVAMVVA